MQQNNIKDNSNSQEKMLSAINKIAGILLSFSGGSFENNLNVCFKLIADVASDYDDDTSVSSDAAPGDNAADYDDTSDCDDTSIDKIVVYKRKISSGRFLEMIYSWSKNEEKFIQVNDAPENVSDIAVLTDWCSILWDGGIVNIHSRVMSDNEKNYLKKDGVKSLLIVPVFFNNRLWGGFAFHDNKKERVFNDDQINFLQSAAYLCVNSILRTSIVREADNSSELNYSLFNASPVGLVIFNEKYEYTDCNDVLLKMFGITKPYFIKNYSYLSPEYQPDGTKSYDKIMDLLKWTLGGESVSFEWMHRSFSGEAIPCEVTTTRIKQGENYIGLAYVYDLRRVKKMEENIKILEAEAEKAYMDSLTGIYNRRYFDENFNILFRVLTRSGGFLSFLMIDIDFFKLYNDTYGHREGDVCLQTVAKTISKSVTRSNDFTARYGGEEFVVILPNTKAKGALKIAERILKNIRGCNIKHEKNGDVKCITVSIGIASGKAKRNHTTDDFIKLADNMLYNSKNNGRNRYSIGKL